MYVIPSHGRSLKLQQLCESMSDNDRKQPVMVVVCDQDPTYEDYYKVRWPESWRIKTAYGEYSYCGEKMNWALERLPRAKYYGHLCDDVLLTGKDTLGELAEAAGDWYMAYPDDGLYRNADLVCFPVTGGKLIREMGFWAHPWFKHNCLDSVLTDVGKTLKVLKPMLHLHYVVKHPFFGTAEMDETYARVETINRKAGFIYDTQWHPGPERKELMARLNKVLNENEVARAS